MMYAVRSRAHPIQSPLHIRARGGRGENMLTTCSITRTSFWVFIFKPKCRSLCIQWNHSTTINTQLAYILLHDWSVYLYIFIYIFKKGGAVGEKSPQSLKDARARAITPFLAPAPTPPTRELSGTIINSFIGQLHWGKKREREIGMIITILCLAKSYFKEGLRLNLIVMQLN